MIEPATNLSIPAATLVIFREGDAALAELLMLERSAAMAFAGGATVFPGGRVDPGDHAVATTLTGDDLDEAAARVAAIRETLEEAGLAIGFATRPDRATVAAMRSALLAGAAFAAVLADHRQRLAPERLTPFARWRPDHPGMRIFDTRFYLAALPGDAGPASGDGAEAVSLGWASATEWLARAQAGGIRLIYPTRRNLERLARFASLDEAVADARAHPIRTITPWIERGDEGDRLCIPDDLGYPVTAEALPTAMRG